MTTTLLTLDNAMRLASDAFQPYGCVTGANAEDDSFSLTIMSLSGNEVLNVPHIPRTQYADPVRLAGVLEQMRLDLIHKGCNLEPWSMPYITDPSAIPESPPNY